MVAIINRKNTRRQGQVLEVIDAFYALGPGFSGSEPRLQQDPADQYDKADAGYQLGQSKRASCSDCRFHGKKAASPMPRFQAERFQQHIYDARKSRRNL